MPESIASPSGTLRADLSVSPGEGLTLTVIRASEVVLSVRRLGVLEPAVSAADVTLGARTDRTVADSFTTVTGKRLEHVHTANETSLRISASAVVDVRVSDDGVAYRYRLGGSGSITSEGAEFSLPEPARLWLAEYMPNNEGMFRPAIAAGSIPGAARFSFPGLAETPEGSWCLLTEAAVTETTPGAHLRSLGSARFALDFPGESIETGESWTSPWRVAIVGDLPSVVASTLVTALNSPSRIEDTSWIRPGRAAWSWWSEFYSPRDLDRQKAYVDFAAAQGWEFCLVDARWDPDWVAELVQYARDRGVDILIWSHWTTLATQDQRDELLPRWKSWGVAGIKVDFMDSESQEQMAWYESLATDAATHRLMVNYHGSTIPKGRQRTWPHVMTYEGILGAEQYVRPSLPEGEVMVPWQDGPNPIHNTIVPFTRNIVGSMDYTPVVFSAPRRVSTAAHELAQAVVYESGWQHYADSIEAYQARPLAAAVLRDVPAAWDETRLLAGRPGEYVVMARRRGPHWWIGCLSAGAPREVHVPLELLDGAAGSVCLIQDAPRESWQGNPRPEDPAAELVESRHTLSATDSLTVPLRADGGFVAHLEVTA